MMKISQDNKEKIRNLGLNIGAIVVLNVVIQFLLYPQIEKHIGETAFGVALSLLSLVSITSNTVGTAANYERMVKERETATANGDYNLFLLLGGLLSAGIGIFYLAEQDLLTPTYAILFSLLILLTTFRYYSDVEFKIRQNFLRYFFFYALISLGYILGLVAYSIGGGNWMITIIAGELFGVLFAALASGIYRKPLCTSPAFRVVWKSIFFLLFSCLLENLTLNADRLILLALDGADSVAIYYKASLFGKVVALLTVPLNAVIMSYLIRYEKELTRRFWAVFVVGGLAVGALGFAGCLLGSYIFLPLPFMYADTFASITPYIVPAIASQIFYFVSGVLVLVLLRFKGERKQFFMNLGYAVEFFLLVIVGTLQQGLEGFVWCALIANLLRFILVAAWGFFPSRASGTEPPATEVEIKEDI